MLDPADGPHDRSQPTEVVFRIQKEELKDEGFLSRPRRSGLGDLPPKEDAPSKGKGENSGNGRKKEERANYSK